MPLLQTDTSTLVEKTFNSPNIIGWILSSLICVLLTALIYPYLEERFQKFFVKNLNFLKIAWGHKLSGRWTHKWYVDSINFDTVNTIKNVELKQFRKTVFAQYDVLDKTGKKYTYQMIGKVDKDMVITGTWRDTESGNRYHGCFQLYIEINEQNLVGYWTGLSKEKHIKSDKWEWIKE